MKILLYFLPLALVSCTLSQKPGTPVNQSKPSILRPPTSEPADLAPVAEINKQLAESNRQLDDLISEGRATRYELNRRMAVILANKSATEDELVHLNDYMIKQQELIDQGKAIISDQTEMIQLQAEQLVEADSKIGAGEIEKEALRATIAKAEVELQQSHELQLAIQTQRDAAKIDAAEASGTIAAITKTSLRRLWWALGVSVVLVLLVLWKLRQIIYPTPIL